MSRAGAGARTALPVLAALLAPACTLPPTPAETTSPPASASAPARSATAGTARAAGPVDVLLARVDGPVVVAGTTAGRVTLERSVSGVRRSGGVEIGSSAVLSAGSGGELGFAGRRYAGQIVVRPAAGAAEGLDVMNRLDLEQYVAGVLAAEVVLWSAMPAELEAQAVAARSYAVAALVDRRRIHREPWLLAGVRDQAYRGLLPEADRGFEGRVDAAVERTRGRVLVEGARVVDARFHAACGGATADGPAVFPEADFACLRSVPCEPCASAEGMTWNTTAPPDALSRAAQGAGVGARLTALEPARRDPSGRWLEVRLQGERGARIVRFEELRGALGPDAVRSARVVGTWPHLGQPIEAGLYLEGRGRGHGVGLCQTGAHGYARQGWSGERILAHYYPGARVVDARAADRR